MDKRYRAIAGNISGKKTAMALRWIVNIEGACGNFFAKSVSPWFSAHHENRTIKTENEAQAALQLERIKSHGYFSVTVDEKHALGVGSTVPCNIHWLLAKFQKKDDPEPSLAGLFGPAPPASSFPLRLAVDRVYGKTSIVVMSLSFEAVQVRNFLTVRNGYIFDFTVWGKTHEEFLKE
jgi:hypothetical protein